MTTANRFTTPRSASFLKNTLLTTQVAASIVLLSSAGLLIRTFWNLESQPLGMRPDHVLTAQFVLPGSRFTKPEQRIGFFNRIEDQLHSIPRIEASGLSDSLPPAGWERSRPLFVLQVVGHPRAQAGTGGMVNWRYVSPGYFKTLQIPVIVGRAFSEQDRRPSVHLIMLSESLALRLFPAGDAVGQHLTIGSDVVYEVAGIVPDIKNSGLSLDPNPEYYILRTHSPDDTYLNSTGPVAQRTLSVLVRASLGREELAATLKQRLSALDPNLPVEIESMDERLNRLLSTPRLYVLLLCGFAFTGLSLASVGLYGTVSYLVVQRTKEIGIRVSLGATPASVSGIMLSYTAKWTLLGAAIGLTVAVTTSKILSSLLFGVSPHDPVTLAVSLCCLLIAAFIAVLAPTRRASAVDPIMALRNDT